MKIQDGSHSAKDAEATNNTRDYDKRLSTDGDTIIRDITYCLMPCIQCPGSYVDNISGDILYLVCRHSCHTNTRCSKNEDKSSIIRSINDWQHESVQTSDSIKKGTTK